MPTVKWTAGHFAGFRVCEGTMEEGASIQFEAPANLSRASLSHTSIVVQGRMVLTRGDGTPEDYIPGYIGFRDASPILYPEPARLTLTCVEGPGRYFCVEPTVKGTKWSREALRDLDTSFDLPAGSVLLLASGEVKANADTLKGPAMIAVTRRNSVLIEQVAENNVGIVMRIVP